MGGCVYIMASGPFGTLYTGVTANLTKRVWQHQESENDGSRFCKNYGVNPLSISSSLNASKTPFTARSVIMYGSLLPGSCSFTRAK